MKTKNNKPEDYNCEITPQEKERLNNENVHTDGGDDEVLRNRKRKPDFEGKDLDVPHSDKAKKNRGTTGLKDEENDIYSQGGNNNDLEEDHSTKN